MVGMYGNQQRCLRGCNGDGVRRRTALHAEALASTGGLFLYLLQLLLLSIDVM